MYNYRIIPEDIIRFEHTGWMAPHVKGYYESLKEAK
jgi:hypothetical protein